MVNTYKGPVIPYHSHFIANSHISLHNPYFNYTSEGQRKEKRNRDSQGIVILRNKCNEGNLGRAHK